MKKPFNKPNAVYIGEKEVNNGYNGHKITISIWEDELFIYNVWSESGSYYTIPKY
jgi:hypothetical protein